MTRSGLAAATLAANCANGQSDDTLQSWNLPESSSSAFDFFLALRRQPVSPKAAIDRSVVFGTGSGAFSTLAEFAPAGSGSSQTRTGKNALGPVSGRARTLIVRCAPSMVIAGHCVALVKTARAIAPCAPSTT